MMDPSGKSGLKSFPAIAATAIALSLAGFHLVTAFSGTLSPMIQRFVHLLGALLLTFLLYDNKGKQHRGSTAVSRWSLIIAALTAALGVYFIVQLNPDAVLNRGIWGITVVEQWTGLLLMVLVLEATRRA